MEDNKKTEVDETSKIKESILKGEFVPKSIDDLRIYNQVMEKHLKEGGEFDPIAVESVEVIVDKADTKDAGAKEHKAGKKAKKEAEEAGEMDSSIYDHVDYADMKEQKTKTDK